MSYHDDIMGALVRGEDPDVAVNRAALRYAVQRQITCPHSGRVLDVRTAVLYTVTDTAGKSGSQCLDPTAWDTIADALRAHCEQTGITLEVIDGRELQGGTR